MGVIRRKAIDEVMMLNHKQLALLCLYISTRDTALEYSTQVSRFKLKEEFFSKLINMPLSHEDRAKIIREFNKLGWEVAINVDYWLLFASECYDSWREVNLEEDDELVKQLLRDSNPDGGLGELFLASSPNSTARFFGVSDEDLKDRLIDLVINDLPEEIQDEFYETEDVSLINLEGVELQDDDHTFWQYVIYYLSENKRITLTK
ncbi:hypothetical protein L3Q72_05355 [Vibrio sp. JC009]|uniref:hypothetical protein n=1 Tax=Vibrio sp. JC009 TaxID=2912314 RepID=UPI0023B185AE|nr:hypothetical protein [Vibrio sp. JC009]WED22820.1 hypothetical protein L3Q72_05355 [Vibrio sp. JC009]